MKLGRQSLWVFSKADTCVHDILKHSHIYIYIVELRTPAMPVGIGGGKERGGCHLNLRT